MHFFFFFGCCFVFSVLVRRLVSNVRLCLCLCLCLGSVGNGKGREEKVNVFVVFYVLTCGCE